MAEKRQSMHGIWSSPWSFILAATGSAVGLGNIWRFPYVTGEYGGSIFILVYILCLLFIGLPIMVSELLLGRRGRRNPVDAIACLAKEEGVSVHWKYLGWLGISTGVIILSFYSVIGGWTLEYVRQAIAGNFAAVTHTASSSIFSNLLADPIRMLGLHTIFMGLTITTVALGVKQGIEPLVKLLMPIFFILLVYMAIFAASTSGFQEGLRYLFHPDWSKLSAETFLVAMGQAFFSLSVGMGALMTYGAYLPKNASIFKVSASIATADMLVAILAGLVIFPLVFSYDLAVGSGPGLIFITLPITFGQFAHGQMIATCFFSLLLFAAWTSAISLLEPIVIWIIENRKISRIRATCTIGAIIWTIGIGTVLSFNFWENYQLFGKTFFAILDYVSSNVMLPMGGLFIALFTAWKMSKKSLREELASDGVLFKIWWRVIAYIAPIGVLLILLHAIDIV